MISDAIAQIAHDTTPVNARRVNMIVVLLCHAEPLEVY